jgi:hypothetical protein
MNFRRMVGAVLFLATLVAVPSAKAGVFDGTRPLPPRYVDGTRPLPPRALDGCRPLSPKAWDGTRPLPPRAN